MKSMRGRHFMDLDDFTREELMLILETTRDLKLETKRGACPPYLAGKALGCIFDQPSTRTRMPCSAKACSGIIHSAQVSTCVAFAPS